MLPPMFDRATFIVALCGALGASAAACFVETESPRRVTEVQPTTPAPEPPTVVQPGKLVVRFTISGSTDPNECAKADAKDFELMLSSADGAGRSEPRGTWRHQCEAFAMSVTLPPGAYTGSAALLDNMHSARTTRVALDPFTVRSNETVHADVTFPSDSFLR